ncbi:hypothetical protein BDN72DRAFT_377221 [Pluteus cervinus]|uniref:Uncharacterized protein n=1 Tax=Pluteus cervinus TaxID=181527 RepID=A0ACD3AAQ3_9AGAR|nr:hypothetical protein BDN72DRAFT_377221 [Pluteus cervinus]
MDLATTLPEEVWFRIFDLLTFQDIRSMMKVHRVFYTYSRPFIWRTLELCNPESTWHRKQAKAIVW